MTQVKEATQDREQLEAVDVQAVRGSLWGRQRECESLSELIARVRSGHAQVMVVRGVRGVGKSALLDFLSQQAAGCRVIRSGGVQAEQDLAYAGLHHLCLPLFDALDRLPQAQQESLRTAFGLSSGGAPDRLAVGVAILSLLTLEAAEKPVVLLISHVEWLDKDTVQVLEFVARRLTHQRVALVIACQSGAGRAAFSNIPHLIVKELPNDQTRSLLKSMLVSPLGDLVEARLAAEIRGNPRLLRETVDGLPHHQLAGGFGTPLLATDHHIASEFSKGLAAMPSATRQLMMLAAADPTGDAVLLWSAAATLGIDPVAAEPALAAGLLEIDESVKFCHPLLRSALYSSASAPARRLVHATLADLVDPAENADRRAWHKGHSVSWADEPVAADLELQCEQAHERGGWPARAAFLARSAELTPDVAMRSKRALAAAEAKDLAGCARDARRLLAMAQAGPLEPQLQARAVFLEASLRCRMGPSRTTAGRLLQAAASVEPQIRARAMAQAIHLSMTTGQAAALPSARDALASVDTANGHERHAPLLRAVAEIANGDRRAYGQPTPTFRLVRDLVDDEDAELAWLLLGCSGAQAIRDDASWRSLSNRVVRVATRQGAVAVLPAALSSAALIELVTDGVAPAAPLAMQADDVARTAGRCHGPYGRLLVAAWQGRVLEVANVVAEVPAHDTAAHTGSWSIATDLAEAVASNSVGRYAEALVAAERGAARDDALGLALWCQAELVEAAVRLGTPERASRALRRLLTIVDATDTDWAVGVTGRASALMSRDDAAEQIYVEAIATLDRTQVRSEQARTRLVYGEWLRRQGRRVDARTQLRVAHDMLAELGLEGFAERARRELLATGGTPRRRTPDAVNNLTAQEVQIARMARDGHSNAEIGVQLYLSHRTVEWHLRKVFMKLGITSRRQLEVAWPD